MFKNDLEKYNELFDECKKIEYGYRREYEKQGKPFNEQME